MELNRASIFLIVPSFNEAGMLRKTIVDLQQHNFPVVVVDDGSTDGTQESVRDLDIHYLRHEVNLGQGAALQTGFEYALRQGARCLVTFDADGQHDHSDIEKLIVALEQSGAGIVFGSRFLVGSDSQVPLMRKLILKVARFLNYLASGILLSDANNGFRALTADAAGKIVITENRSTHSAQIQTLVKKNNIKYIEVPVNVKYTEYSRSKGISNIRSIRILYELILFKLFR